MWSPWGQNKTADLCRPERGAGAGRGRNEWAGEAKRVGKVALVCSRPEAGRGKDSPPRRPQTSAIKARVRQGDQGNSFHSECPRGWESRSIGRVPCFHSMSVETPSLSWSWWAKPGIRVSIPCSRAQVSGIPSGDVWHSWSDSLCSIPSTKSLAFCACEAAETINLGSFSSLLIHDPR